MKEHIIFEKIELYKNEAEKKPLFAFPTILLLTYLSLAKRYEELLTHAEQFLMSSISPPILVEDFNLLGNLALGKIDTAKTIFKNITSLDPEDAYAHLLMATAEQKEYLELAYIFSQQTEKRKISEFLGNKPEINQNHEFYIIPDIIGVKDRVIEKIQNAIEKDTTNPVLKVSLSETLLKLGQIDEAEKELNNILLIYPNYPRALYLYAKIEGDYKGNDQKGISCLKKIFNLNPVSQYLKGAEVMFLNEKESTLENELKGVFEMDNPFAEFFKEYFKKSPEKNIKKEEEKLTNKEAEELPEIDTTNDPLEKGFKALDKRNYQEAIKDFLKELKKK